MRMLVYLCLFWLIACNDPDDVADQGTSQMEEDTIDMNDTPDTGEDHEEDTTDTGTDSLTFLALGDSYTIGESVPEYQRWPVQLRDLLVDSTETPLKSPKIIARTGWTTGELQEAINGADIEGQTFSMVSLLIGVNNQYRGYPVDQYRTEFPALLNQALSFAGGDASKVFVVSIPDYGVTPFGQNMDSEKIAKEIDLYNDLAKGFAEQFGVTYFDITPISREAADNPDLVAEDGLHPSGEMYRRWVEKIYPWAKDILDQ